MPKPKVEQQNDGINKLFGVHPDNLKWGVTKGQHVAHMYTGKESGMIELKQSEPKTNDIAEVSQSDAYKTTSDFKTEAFFRDLARKSAEAYSIYGNNAEFAKIMKGIKTYVTAASRSGQQQALDSVLGSIASFKKKYAPAEKNKKHNLYNAFLSISQLEQDLKIFNNGSLLIPEEEQERLKNEVPEEPADAQLGHLGKWTKYDGPIFPHEPSPNDIKQGKINDCFMMSSLIKIANDHPEKIRNAIRDNGDGTVTVRFFNGRRIDNELRKVPVYVKVNKTVNKTLTGQHTYASTSPWVQMVEKAYAEFMEHHYAFYTGNPNLHGYQRLDRGTSSIFLDAFDDEKFYASAESEFGYCNQFDRKRYDYSEPKPEGYNDYEEELFGFLSKANKGDVMTVGSKNEANNKGLQKYLSSVGIHTGHAYTLLGTFEKNGKKYVQLQDPFASFRAGYDKNGKLVDNSALASATLNAGTSNMGKFNLELVDFLRTFDSFSGMSKDNYWVYKGIRDKHLDLYRENANKQQKAAKPNDPNGGLANDFTVLDNPNKVDKPNLDEYDNIEDEDVQKPNEVRNGFVDNFVQIKMPGVVKTDYSKMAEARLKINKCLETTTKENKLEMSIQIEDAAAIAFACYTVNDLIAKHGEHMEDSQIKDLLSEEMINKAAQDLKKSDAFKSLVKDQPTGAIKKFLDTGDPKDFKPVFDRYTKRMRELSKEKVQPQKQQAVEKDNNILQK